MYRKGQTGRARNKKKKKKLKPFFLFVSSGWGCAGALVM
jgi:hypothetical protein